VRLGKLSDMTDNEANPPQPFRPDPGPEETTELRAQTSGAPTAPGAAERSEPQAGSAAGPAGAGAGAPYAPPPGPWAPPSPPPQAQAPVPPPSPWQQPAYAPPSAPPAPPGWQQPTAPNQPNQPPMGMPPMGAPPMGPPPGPGTYRPPSRVGRRLAAGVGVLALAVGSGVLGGWIAQQSDDGPTTTVAGASNTAVTDPAPVINRDDLANVAAAVQPSVVSIRAGNGEGSGVVYDDQGNIVTNNHVVASASGGAVTVIFNDGKKAEARVVSTDPRTDLAVVRVSGASGLTPAKIGDSGSMRVGDTVIALGSPLGLQGTVTAGIISALDRTIQVGDDQDQNPFQRQQSSQAQSISGVLQTDAPINPGNSGGPLANTKGEVIGINTAILGSSGNIGVGFAIPSNKVKNVADQLIKGGKVSHPFLGVSVTEATNGGALVQSVTENSPAARAGIQEGDVITGLGGKTIANADDLISAVQSGNVGDRLELNFTRNGAQQTATVTLADAS
jgi:putative serine protease PepD